MYIYVLYMYKERERKNKYNRILTKLYLGKSNADVHSTLSTQIWKAS